MIKEYYFNNDFIKLLDLDINQSYTPENIFNRMKAKKFLKKKVKKLGRYGVSKHFYYTNDFYNKLELIIKSNNLMKRCIKKKFPLSYARNILWRFIIRNDLSKSEFRIDLNLDDFNFVESLEI